MISDGSSSLSGRQDRPRIARRLEIRLATVEALEKFESGLSDLRTSGGVEILAHGWREHVRRLNLKIVGPMIRVAGIVRAVKGLGAQIMRDEVLRAPGAPPDPPYPDPESGRRIAVPGRDVELRPPLVPVPDAPVIVAIIDSGIMTTHPNLLAHLGTDHGFGVLGSNIPNSDIEDADGHGTMLAGTVLAGADLSPDVRLMAVKFFDGRTIPESGRAAWAIDEAVRRGAHILNLSWAVGIDKPDGKSDRAIRGAIERAPQVLFVVAAGNSGADNDTHPTVPATYGRDLRNVITVMATDEFDDSPGFSNYGATSVHIAAPGMRVVSTHSYLTTAAQPGDLVMYQRFDGTSPAAAYVAGAAALLKSQNPTLSPKDIRDILIATADRRSDLRCVAQGRLNVSQALASVQALGGVAATPAPSGHLGGYSLTT